jgi:hypothetical protein
MMPCYGELVKWRLCGHALTGGSRLTLTVLLAPWKPCNPFGRVGYGWVLGLETAEGRGTSKVGFYDRTLQPEHMHSLHLTLAQSVCVLRLAKTSFHKR